MSVVRFAEKLNDVKENLGFSLVTKEENANAVHRRDDDILDEIKARVYIEKNLEKVKTIIKDIE